jgi:hypothetical protein
MMRKIVKPVIALSIAAAFAFSAVLCCCTASAVMTHFHKKVICSDCPNQNDHGKSSSPIGDCQQQLTSADLSQVQTIVSSAVSGGAFPAPVILIGHHTSLTHSLLFAYPPGGPPLGISFTPLYLRTFNLRI